MTQKLQQLYEAIPSQASIKDLGRLIAKVKELYDVEHVAYMAFSLGRGYALSTSERAEGLLAREAGFWQRDAGALVAVTYDKTWGERYAEAAYARIDPVLEETTRSFAPFNWKSLSWESRKRRKFLREAVECGLGNQGYAVPVRGPDGQFALFVVNNSCSDERWEKFINENKGDMLVIAHYFHQKVLEIEKVTVARSEPLLSSREVDVLTGISVGKNRSQIAHDLSISENTLRVYLDSARHKLGALNITHAVAIGIHRGLINI
jgi:DNA-binding CsgD family transcriptional regulator